MTTDPARLAEMLCTRLCHDLTGPIGAVNNGAEFLSEDGASMDDDALQLIISSATEAVSRLMFYRQVYGRTGESGEASLSEKKQLTAAFFEGSKITLDWPDQYGDACDVSVSHRGARLIMNLALIASAALIRGGTLSVRIASPEAGVKQFTIEAQGQTVKNDPAVAAILQGDHSAPICPKTAQLYLTAELAEKLGANITVEAAEERLSLRATSAVVMDAVAAQ